MRLVLTVFLSCLLSFSGWAKVSLPQFFADGMVLQRDKEIKIWGKADPQERVTVRFKNKTHKTKADRNGYWQLTMPAQAADALSNTLTVKAKSNTLTIKDILIGDVWICSGQSNMEWILGQFNYGEAESQQADYQNIRLLTIDKNVATTPAYDIKGQWKKAVGTNVLEFSAVAYYFGKKLHKDLNIPLGLISTNYGGTNVEAWISTEALSEFEAMKPFLIKPDDRNEEINAKNATDFEQQIATLLKSDVGMSQKWYERQTSYTDWKTIDIPFAKDTSALKGHKGSLWFSKEFEVPMQYRGTNLELVLGRLADYDEVWINGHYIGHTYGAKEWRRYFIESQYLNPKGKNNITWRVFNARPADLTLDKDPLYFNIHGIGNSKGYLVIAGNWKYKKGITLNKEMHPPARRPNKPNQIPASLYNGMLHPFIPMGIKGVIWYQGETNGWRAAEYKDHFAALITDWRNQFQQGNFPFLFVQLANYRQPCQKPCASEWAELRESQAAASGSAQHRHGFGHRPRRGRQHSPCSKRRGRPPAGS